MSKVRPSTQWQQDGATDGQVWRWDDGAGVYVPVTPSAGTVARDLSTASGGEDTLTLGATPVDDSPLVWVNGTLLWPGTDYTISGAVITFGTALTASDVVTDYYLTDDASPGAAALTDSGAVTEDFAAGTMPGDITHSSGPTVTSSTGNPLPCLQASGNGQWWYFGSRFDVSGDFTYSFDINFPSGSRDICNMAFWVNSPGSSADGFIFRLQSNTSTDHDSGLYKLSGGSHSIVDATMDAVPTDVWLHVTLSMSGTTLTYLVMNGATTVQSGTYDLSGQIDGTHPTSGGFGQASDGAGGTHYLDNFSLT